VLRLSWTQPEDLLPHALASAAEDGRDVANIRERWVAAGGTSTAAVSGATPTPASPRLRALARVLLEEIDSRPAPAALRAVEPDDLEEILSLARPDATAVVSFDAARYRDRLLGAWLGRASGCLLGKPVEKISREGIRAIAQSTGNWPIRSYFTEVGLDPVVATAYPWNRRSRPTSLIENIDGMPEDDDLNFPLIALRLVESIGRGFSTDDVAQSWLDNLPGGRVFTAERITYRNLLDGYEPEIAGSVQNPFRDWIGAQIRTDVYGWISPGNPVAAARMAWTDARLSHGRSGVYGAMFVAAACAVAVTGASVEEAIAAGLSVVPPESRYASAVRRGVEIGRSELDTESALDAIYAEYGHLHWVHALNNSALLAFALTRGAGDFVDSISLAVTGGLDTDSVGATVGSITGAIAGASGLPGEWITPLRNRLATSVPGFDDVRFDDLAARTLHIATMPNFDPDEANTNDVNPLVPRAIDLPTTLPGGGGIDPAVGDIAKIFAAPDDPADWPSWRADLATWRERSRARLGYSGAAYEARDTAWTKVAYSVAQVWLWDERLFDHERQAFTVDSFLASTSDHGGFDGVVLWHAYPIIGIDDRNQFDFYRDVPGLTTVIDEFKSRGIRVFVDYNPWDTGTRRENRADPEELAALVGELGVDGVFLDTMKEGDSRLIDALRGATPPQVLEGESRVPNQRIEDHQLSWAQWFADSDAPGVMRAHWYERRHMMHSTRRWNRDHSGELQSAWMNGTGILVWDAVFGVWVGWNDRDKQTLRRMLRVQRAASEVLIDGEWSPLDGATSDAVAAGIYASRFELGDLTLWTLVNRRDEEYVDAALADPSRGRRFDLTSGRELASAAVMVPARGIAGVLEVRGTLPEWLEPLLLAAQADARDADVSSEFPVRHPVRVVPSRAFVPAAPSASIVVDAGQRDLAFRYRRRETGVYDGAPYVEEWKPLPPRLHDARAESITVDIARVAVAASEVTVAEFSAFVADSGYVPASPNRFLVGSSTGEGSATVVGVSLEDARAYAGWVGARLPTEFEWQLAAAVPGFSRRSPLVWNWTESEHSDGITRFVMLKGGSAHESSGSDWYTDGGPRDAEFSLKYLLAGLGVERSPSIGFRLAWDLEAPA